VSTFFQHARPIWPRGRHQEMNLTVGARCVINLAGAATARLLVTARDSYRAWCDGRFLGYGPARSAHGHLRVDVYELRLQAGQHLIAIEANSYNIPSFVSTDERPLVQAEVILDGVVVAATGIDHLPARWQTLIPNHRIQKIQRLSRQRGFSEAWRLSPNSFDWRISASAPCTEVPTEPVQQPVLQPRLVPHPAYTCISAARCAAAGRIEKSEQPTLHKWEQRMREASGTTLIGYPHAEWEIDLSGELGRCILKPHPGIDHDGPMAANTWRMMDFGVNHTGFLRARLTCHQPAVLYLAGDELPGDGVCDVRRAEYLAGARYELQPGEYELQMAEIIAARMGLIMVLSGSVTVHEFGLRQYERTTLAEFACADGELVEIFRACVRTFAHNAVDIYLDCPSRERAGWLCDSFFTGRVEPWLTGTSDAETVFVGNYLLSPPASYLPAGMLAKCYPSDAHMTRGGTVTFIPNWALWLVLQLEEFAQRGGDAEVIAAFRPRCAGLFACLEQFRNSDGLVEKLPSWVFIDWSAANDYVQDVSYPSNMLYAAALDAAGRLYNHQPWRERAAEVRRLVLAQSWDGSAFCDNANRDSAGRLALSGAHTEACQYYAFFFGIATPQSHPALWQELLSTCSAAPEVENPRFAKAAIFISLHLRLLLLARYGQYQQLMDELRQAFLPMARLTGTLWEHAHPRNSCDHGFCSHAAHLLLSCILGLNIDRAGRTVHLTVPAMDLPWCRARLPLDNSWLEIGWRRQDDKVIADVAQVPAGWKVNLSGVTGNAT